MEYNHKKIEEKWKDIWEESGVYRVSDESDKPKYFILDMFPYPSGEGLHVGHPKGYIATDIFARMKMMQGFNVLHPMGWDAFGLPAENYAIKNKVHPRAATEKNIETFKRQLGTLGLTYDWEREISTIDPDFYKWTQWIFLQMFKKGLAYESHEPINWCPSCKTGLANEDLENGLCERCESEIERKPMRQWVLKITDYADRLLDDIDKLEDWDESIKEQQRNWIGRSEGAEVEFRIKSPKDLQGPLGTSEVSSLKVFTTRPDTLFGATYMVVAPEHSLIEKNKEIIENYDEIADYIKKALNKSELERGELQKEKTGVKIEGLTAVNPVNGAEIPVFVADYVLAGYGTGAIMAVPAHDERDWEFAKKYGLEIIEVVEPEFLVKLKYPQALISESDINYLKESFKVNIENDEIEIRGNSIEKFDEFKEKLNITNFECDSVFEELDGMGGYYLPWTKKGKSVNSYFLNGLETDAAKSKMITWLEEKNIGEKSINYKLVDWVFSRQRYWGEPIPLVHCEKCGVVPVPEKDLPVLLPDVENYEPTGTGESPLAGIDDWVNTTCPKCAGKAKRETNTMPQWAGSSWYYLRYIDPKNSEALVDKDKEAYWSPVDFYVGGAEHATRHLIYARFWHKFLFDIGAVGYDEPFKRLQYVGLIQGEDNRKMSKRWGNVINPDEIVDKYGADSLRVYEMFMGPFSQAVAWSTNGLVGARKFLEKVVDYFNVYFEHKKETEELLSSESIKKALAYNKRLALLHKTIKKVEEDVENFKFNTAIAQMMILLNELRREVDYTSVGFTFFQEEHMKSIVKILAPFAPHLAEEIWSSFAEASDDKSDKINSFVIEQKWPKYNPELIIDKKFNLVLQVNGKVRDMIEVDADISEEEAKKLARENEKVLKWIADKEVVKVIFVKGKLVNMVVK
ncbi:MAG: class I tRNA ligase family protein [Patescibacteria group bacterium]|nr:class I tRNA ligase family protein [Patescibacteria group bacterium]